MQKLTESISKYLLAVVCPLIKTPDKAQLRVAANEEEKLLRFRLVLEPGDIARIIGRNGMTASAIRSLAKAAGEKAGAKVIVHILSREELEEAS
ncbi:MAG: KH domain-containing protein [Akkermansia sp.]|nr:KH domain-containing protein [Akkermansia sp.]MDO5465196.1 KH domain-containing protein [Akkermansia sp.]